MKRLICFAAALMLWVSAGYAASEADSCLATSDINGDALPLTISDLTLTIRIITGEASAPNNLFEIDLNGDCAVNRADLDLYASFFIYSPPPPPWHPVQTCCSPTLTVVCMAAKGDVNADGGLTPADAVLMLSCVFTQTGNCSFCFADLNCDFELTPSDVVQELNYVFLGTPPAGCP